MSLPRRSIVKRISSHLVMVGVVFVVLYWFIESAMHSYWFKTGPILQHAFRPDGHEIWMRLIVASLLISFSFYGQIVINRLKRAERALIEREKEALRILENNPAAIVLIDCDTNSITYANSHALNMSEYTAESLLEKAYHSFFRSDRSKEFLTYESGPLQDTAEQYITTANGSIIPILKSVTKVKYKGKNHLLEAFFDNSAQKNMQQAIRQANAELNDIFQTATVGMRLIDQDFNILKVNQTFTKLSGVTAEHAIGRKCYEVFAGAKCHTTDCPLKKVLSGIEVLDYEVSKTRADGTALICNVTVSSFTGGDGRTGIVEAFKDITELKRIQNELQAERDKLHNILFHQFESVGIITDEYLLEYQNELLKKHTSGKEPCYCYEVFRDNNQPCEGCLMQEAFNDSKIQRVEFDTSSGRIFQHTYTPFVDNDGQQKAVISRLDVTEQKASMATAISSERLAALGELAAGVAHEINNPINGIINYAQILVNRITTDEQLVNISSRIIGEGNRIAAIVASLLSFSRKEGENCNSLNINELLEQSLTLTGAQLKKDGIILTTNLDTDLLTISAVAQEIQQVFLNIINNSRYALNEKHPGFVDSKRLHIETCNVPEEHPQRVRASFTDYGTGIPEDLLHKVFNPFISTKPTGKGTGLGLTISHRIIENHGGTLTIESAVGEFTRIVVELPSTINQ